MVGQIPSKLYVQNNENMQRNTWKNDDIYIYKLSERTQTKELQFMFIRSYKNI